MRKGKSSSKLEQYTTSGLVSINQIVDATGNQILHFDESTNPKTFKYEVKPEK